MKRHGDGDKDDDRRKAQYSWMNLRLQLLLLTLSLIRFKAGSDIENPSPVGRSRISTDPVLRVNYHSKRCRWYRAQSKLEAILRELCMYVATQ
jgi:hypothetical protein